MSRPVPWTDFKRRFRDAVSVAPLLVGLSWLKPAEAHGYLQFIAIAMIIWHCVRSTGLVSKDYPPTALSSTFNCELLRRDPYGLALDRAEAT